MTAVAETRGRTKDRDFTVFNDTHRDLAIFVNQHSGLAPVTANQIKAVLALRTDYNESPERAAALEKSKADREAKKAKYAGLSDDQVKAVKKAERLAAAAAKAKADMEALFNS